MVVPEHYVPLDQIDFLRPADKIRQYAQSPILAHRIYIARSLYRILPRITRQSTFNKIMPYLNALAVDNDRSVKMSLASSLGDLFDTYGNAQARKLNMSTSSDSLGNLMSIPSGPENGVTPPLTAHFTRALHLSTTPSTKVTTYLPDHFLIGVVLPLLMDGDAEVNKVTKDTLIRAVTQTALLNGGALRFDCLGPDIAPQKHQLSAMILEWLTKMVGLTPENAETYVDDLLSPESAESQRSTANRSSEDSARSNGHSNGNTPDTFFPISPPALVSTGTGNISSSPSSNTTSPVKSSTHKAWKPQFIDHTSAYAHGTSTYNSLTDLTEETVIPKPSSPPSLQASIAEQQFNGTQQVLPQKGIISGLLFVMNHESDEEREAREKSVIMDEKYDIRHVIQHKVETIRGAMLDLICEVYKCFNTEQVDVLLGHIETCARSECISERGKAAAALVIAARLPVDDLQNCALPLIKVLANDTIYHVRRAIAQVLPVIVAVLPYELRVKHMISLVDSLTKDISKTVRDTMYNGIAYCIVGFAQETHYDTPLLSVLSSANADSQDCTDADTVSSPYTFTTEPCSEGFLDNYESFTSVCNYFSRPHQRRDSVLPAIPPRASHIERIPPSFLQCFMLANMRWKDPDRIAKCAYYIPGIIYTLGPDCWTQLRSLYLTLCGDSSTEVKKPLVKSFHVVAQVLGSDIITTDFQDVIKHWLRDTDEIRVPLLRRLPYVLHYAPQDMRDTYSSLPTDTLKAEAVLGRWRVRKAIATTVHLWWSLYCTEDKLESLVNCLAQTLTDRVERVRMASLRCLQPIFTTSGKKDVKDLMHRLLQLAASASYVDRIMFVYVAKEIISELSPEHQSQFWNRITHLASDPVAGVRIVIAKWITCVQDDLQNSDDDKLNTTFRALREKLVNDTCSTIVGLLT